MSSFVTVSNELLAQRAYPLLEERIPVVAYGSNSNPYRLSEKMGAYGPRGELQTVPNAVATIPDTVVAWHGRPGQTGSVFAELFKSEGTKGDQSLCHLSYLTPQQLALMHATEGVTYHLAPISVLAGRDHQPVRANAYVAGLSRVLLQDGKPIMVRRPGEKATEHTMTAEEAVDYMLQNTQDVIGIRTARELVDEMRGLPLSERKRIQSIVHQALGRVGISEDFTFPTEHPGFIGRADLNFASKGGLLHLAEEVVESLRPTDSFFRQQQKN